MKRTKIFLLFIICIVPFSIFCVTNVTAYNYEPGVNIGDEIVYIFNSTSPTYQDVTHFKINVTSITDVTGGTLIEGYIDHSEDGGTTYGYETSALELALLRDYDPNPQVIFDDLQFLVVPGTKIGKYEAEIQALLSSGTANSIEFGYGLEISNSTDINRIQVYDKDGFLVKYWNEDTYIYEADILSINGVIYEWPQIPGYSTLLILAFSIIGLLGVFALYFRKNK